MELIRAEDILCGLASQFVVHNRNILPDCGILMSLRIQANNHGYEKNGDTFHKNWQRSYRKNIHFIIVRPYSVFVAVVDEYDWRNVPLNAWKNTSNHDSCWRTDGFCDIFPETMKAYHACYDHVPEKHRPAPIAANISATFSPSLRNPIVFVSVIKKKSEDDRAYRYVLSSIRDLNPKFPALEGDMFYTETK